MLTMGLTGKALTNLVGPGRLTTFGVRFVSQVWPGDTLTATTTVTALRREGERLFADLEVKTSNQDGVAVMTGHATALVEGPPLEALPD
jgi:acyl dehydratase